MTDLLKSVKQESEIDLSSIKISALALVGGLFSLGFAFFLSRLYQNTDGLTLNIVFTLALGTLFLVVVFLQSILIKETGRVGAILFLQSAVMLIPFVFSLTVFILIGFLITYLLLFWGNVSGKKELQYSMKVRIFRLSKFVLPKAITGLSIFVAASYMGVFQDTGLLVSQDTFKRIVLPAEAVTKIIMPGFSLEDSFTTLIEKSHPEIKTFTKSEEAGVIKQQQAYFGQILQYKFEANDTIVDILYNAYAQNIGQVSSNSKIVILFGLGIILFLLIKSVGTPIAWFVALVAAAVYEILIALGFAVVVLETKSREIVLLK